MKVRNYSDWVGFVFCTSFAMFIAFNSWQIGVLFLPAFLHELFCAITFLTRGSPKASLSGLMPKVFAYACSFLPPLAVLVFRRSHPAWFALNPNTTVVETAGFIWIIGSILAIWNIWTLRGSFSIEPEARTLVTDGPYAFARHPIYACYVLQYSAFLVAMPHLPILIGYVAWIAIMLVRIHYEEKVLAKAFPEYATYRTRVGAFGPRFSRLALRSAAPSSRAQHL